MLLGAGRLARVQQVLRIQQMCIRQSVIVVHQLVDRERAVGVGDGLADLAGAGVQARQRVVGAGPALQVDLLGAVAQGGGQHRAGAAVVAGVGVGLAEQQRVAHQLGQVTAGLLSQLLRAVVHERDRAGGVAGADVEARHLDVEVGPLRRVRRIAHLQRLLEQLQRLPVAAATGRDQGQALVALAHALGVGVDLGLAQHAAQQLLGLLVLLEPDHHHGVQHLERAGALLVRDLSGQLLGRDAEAAGDLDQHARAGPAVAGLDASQVAVGAAVEGEVALGHRAPAAEMPDPGSELAQGLVRVVKLVIVLQHAGPSPGVHSWQSYSHVVVM